MTYDIAFCVIDIFSCSEITDVVIYALFECCDINNGLSINNSCAANTDLKFIGGKSNACGFPMKFYHYKMVSLHSIYHHQNH